jgi:hypothetical protein
MSGCLKSIGASTCRGRLQSFLANAAPYRNNRQTPSVYLKCAYVNDRGHAYDDVSAGHRKESHLKKLPYDLGIRTASKRKCWPLGPWKWSALVSAIIVCMGQITVPMALADSTTSLRQAVASTREGMTCPLTYNSVVEQVADIINRSTDDYLNQTATKVPILDPLEGLKELGHPSTKAYLLQGADKSQVLAIKGALLEGYAAIPDCSYSEFGVSMRQNAQSGFFITAVVLAGN